MSSNQRSYSIEKRPKLLFFSKKWRIKKIRARRGEEITMTSRTSFDVWFPPGRNPIEAFNTSKTTSNRLTLKVKEDAQPGEYEFSVFCYDDNKMAVGNSSPRMIIIE